MDENKTCHKISCSSQSSKKHNKNYNMQFDWLAESTAAGNTKSSIYYLLTYFVAVLQVQPRKYGIVIKSSNRVIHINQPVFDNSTIADYIGQCGLEVQLVRLGLYLFAMHPFPALV